METAWIQVFVLTLAECVAPAGKSICQEQQLRLEFLTQADCEVALEQLIDLKTESQHVIVDPSRSKCAPSTREREVFATVEAIDDAYKDKTGWHLPVADGSEPTATQVAHRERLAKLRTCEESRGVAPCKIGEIIIEGANGDPVEVWRSD